MNKIYYKQLTGCMRFGCGNRVDECDDTPGNFKGTLEELNVFLTNSSDMVGVEDTAADDVANSSDVVGVEDTAADDVVISSDVLGVEDTAADDVANSSGVVGVKNTAADVVNNKSDVEGVKDTAAEVVANCSNEVRAVTRSTVDSSKVMGALQVDTAADVTSVEDAAE